MTYELNTRGFDYLDDHLKPWDDALELEAAIRALLDAYKDLHPNMPKNIASEINNIESVLDDACFDTLRANEETQEIESLLEDPEYRSKSHD